MPQQQNMFFLNVNFYNFYNVGKKRDLITLYLNVSLL